MTKFTPEWIADQRAIIAKANDILAGVSENVVVGVCGDRDEPDYYPFAETWHEDNVNRIFESCKNYPTALDEIERLHKELAAYQSDIDDYEKAVSQVYDELTCGKFTKINTEPLYVIEAATEYLTADLEAEVTRLQAQVAELLPYRDGYDPKEKLPDADERAVIQIKHGTDRWHSISLWDGYWIGAGSGYVVRWYPIATKGA